MTEKAPASHKPGAVPCQCHRDALGSTLVELYGVEVGHTDVPAWVSASSGTFVPWLIVQDRRVFNIPGTIETMPINTAPQTLLCDLDSKQVCTSGSFCQTHPNHPRSPASLGLGFTICLILLNSDAWK